ncbi:MAG TPA: PilZ domain-containing protein [Thermoanaerobaculia bacterium]|nr:PilZ domain-containing protein [Thermoanaerobaculia bacterium]
MPEYKQVRRFPRASGEFPMFVELLSGRPYAGFSRTRTLGSGGCMFETDETLGFLSLMKMSISVGGRIVNADGRVAYERRTGDQRVEVGVEFLRVAPADRSHLEDVVLTRQQQPA